MHRGRRRPDGISRTVAVACLAAAVLFAPPALAEPGEPSPSSSSGAAPAWTPDEDSPVGDQNDTPLSGKRLEDQVAEAERLSKQIVKDDREISTAAKELKEYSTKANTLLQRQAKARDAYEAATLAADEADQQLTVHRGAPGQGPSGTAQLGLQHLHRGERVLGHDDPRRDAEPHHLLEEQLGGRPGLSHR